MLFIAFEWVCLAGVVFASSDQGLHSVVYNVCMTVILTHEKADFDAIASQLGARKLFAESVALLPWSVNRNVQHFLNLYWDALPFVRAEDWRRRKVNDVVLVDTQSLGSIRGLGKNVTVRVIDHHPLHNEQPAWDYQLEAVGATATLLVEKLQEAGIHLTPEESTLMLLGIYEDTGSLTYDSTTVRDVRAAAWLLDEGAQLAVARRFLDVALSEAQQWLYDELMSHLEWLRIEDRPLLVASATAPAGFQDEISAVAHRLREALSPDGLFVLVGLGDGVQMVARSTSEAVDVGTVARALGGGGHSRAAAAMMVGVSLESAHRELLQILPTAVLPSIRVESIMSHGLVTISDKTSVAEAAALMIKLGHEGYPVVHESSGRLVGLLTRRSVDRAMSHELGHLPVSRVMRAGNVSVTPQDSVEAVQQIMISEGWGQVPVTESKDNDKVKLLGIVTRTDVLNALALPSPSLPEPDIGALMERSFPPPLWALVRAISSTAGEMAMPVYTVGGQVRDLLLNKAPTDLDIVVEGDAIELVRKLQERYGGEVHSHARFGTAKWAMSPSTWEALEVQAADWASEGRAEQIIRIAMAEPMSIGLPTTVDFVTARKEFYKRPTALPDVERGSIKLDLHRRDFTVNTLAIRLDGAHLGQLLDFYGGRRDLQLGVIRVLHSLSFIDDPTRILRAIRLEQRLDFTIEKGTAELMMAALPLLTRVSGERLRSEIELALHEDNPARVLARFEELSVLENIVPGLALLPQAVTSIAGIPQVVGAMPWREIYESGPAVFYPFALWLAPLDKDMQRLVADRLRVRKATAGDLLAIGDLHRALQKLPSDAPVSLIARAMRPFEPRVLLATRLLNLGPQINEWLEHYINDWRHVRTLMSGDDLRAWGLSPGPIFTQILDELLSARLDGRISGRDQEEALVAKLLAQP